MKFLDKLFNKKQKKIEKLWRWVEKNIYRFADIQKDDSILVKFKEKLNKINPFLVFAIEINKSEDEVNSIIISADGMIKAFNDVIEVIRNAPEIEGWEIKAFRQEKDVSDISIQIGEFTLTADKIAFTYFKDKNKSTKLINLNVYIKDSKELNNGIRQAVFIFLDSAIGEFYVGTRIGRVGIGLAKEYQAHDIESRLYSLDKLAEVVLKETREKVE